jgi:hypothetical protein
VAGLRALLRDLSALRRSGADPIAELAMEMMRFELLWPEPIVCRGFEPIVASHGTMMSWYSYVVMPVDSDPWVEHFYARRRRQT